MVSISDQIADGNDFVYKHIYSFESDMIRSLFESYEAALREMGADLTAIWQSQGIGETWDTSDIQAREALLAQITARIDILIAESEAQVIDDLVDSYYAAQYGVAYSMDQAFGSLLPDGFNIPILPVEAVRAQLLAPYVGEDFVSSISTSFADSRDEFIMRLRRSLIQSQIAGESINEAMRRIRDELGIVTDRRLKADRQAHRRNFNRVQMIARTELLRAANLGALAIYKANRDVLKGWEWLTSVDDRVCIICAPLDGVVFTFDDEPSDSSVSPQGSVPPPAHPQCRCTVVPALNDEFAELAREIEGDRKRATQDGLSVGNFEQWRSRRGLIRNRYGQVYDRRGQKAPQMEIA